MTPGPASPNVIPVRLTVCQLRVLAMVTSGMSNYHIAKTCRISLRATEDRVSRLFDLTESRNRAQLVAWAFRNIPDVLTRAEITCAGCRMRAEP